MERAGSPPLEVTLGIGRVLYRGENVVGRVHIRDVRTLWRILRAPELAFGDAYSTGRADVHGDLTEVLYHLYRCLRQTATGAARHGFLGRPPRPSRNTLSGSRHNIHHHYDLGNDFYRLWLDRDMVYTCAYYRSTGDTLEQAQQAKMEHVCRKLRLAPGMQVVEAGCGWGSLALYMARHHGVRVRAFNISEEQIAFARERVKREGLQALVEFVQDDYRNVSGSCDAFVSVGMLEHVGVDNYPQLGDTIARCLRPQGLALLHSVGRSRPEPSNVWLEQRIFPGSYPPALREIMHILEPHRFDVLDVENLRLHYARTLAEWLRRFDACLDTIGERYDGTFVRAWRLYLAGCSAAFRASTIQLFQVVFSHPGNNALPLTREHLYGDSGQSWSEF
jgi:cyclopropane-fatty-acyl-phospholipid synthase